ncbi:Transcription factor [Aspergillus sclerotialis]|uniref:Transcription factor n=1 Tax=Aspergillus sclerotialis TaxID=2070753 RepID=A0A3A2ZXS8_9EURO|nr:Transcription factor [Aspergillus sclerotialis]
MPSYPIRRRPRECKTCLPCRASKVRCDRNLPCSNCVKRNFNCSYGRPPPNPFRLSTAEPTGPATTSEPSFPSRGDLNPSSSSNVNSRTSPERSSETVTISQNEWDEINSKMSLMEQTLSSLNSLFQTHSTRAVARGESAEPRKPSEEVYGSGEGIYGSNALKTGDVHIGSQSALVDILDRSKGSEDIAQALPKDDLLAELALGNESAAYPFVDLWSSDPFTFNITAVCAVLPDDGQCRMFMNFYRDIGAVLYPVLGDTSTLEQNMNRLLQGRVQAGGSYRPDANEPVKPFGMSLGFLSLLFAVLASGCQLSDLAVHERELTSWVYVSCSYQCLRMMNYVSQPTVEVIQILLIISNVLSYNMNAGASYTLLGMTERLCMVLGLHVESTGFPPAEQAIRRRVWWAMVFQNSHFSLAYDRPAITMVSQPEIPFDQKSMPGYRSYFETLSRVISLALDLLRVRMLSDRSHSHLRYHENRDFKQRMQRVLAEATPHLRHRDQCTTLAEHIERTELRLHSSYLLSVICRVSLEPTAHLDDQRRAIIREECINNLISTIDAFVELHSVNSHSSRSWISLQRTIASAFLLVAHADGQLHPQTWSLISQLELVLTDHVYANGEVDHNGRTDSAKHLASSLRALREVNSAIRQKQTQSTSTTTSTPEIETPEVRRTGEFLHPGVVLPPVQKQARPGQVSVQNGQVQNILGRVSDVMLFPSMG